MSETISDLVEARIKTVFDRHLRSSVKVSVGTLAAWRKRGLISHSRYPVGRIRKEGDKDRLTDIYTYDIADMLSFCERYKIRSLSADVYQISPEVSALGPELRSRAIKRAA